MNNQQYREFRILFGNLPVIKRLPKSWSRETTRRHLEQWLRIQVEGFIDRGVWERNGNEETEIKLTVNELMETY